MTGLDEIHASLADVTPGPLTKATVTEVEGRLSACWDLLEGWREGGMEGSKLVGRTETMAWYPPTLRFQLERHGGTVRGSSRAELQRWEIDLDNKTATIVGTSWRQLRPASARMDVQAIAKEIASIVIEGRDDPRVEHRDGSVTIRTAVIIPSTNNQTTTGRRSRFLQRLDQLLSDQGWRRRTGGGRPIFDRQIPD